MTPEIDLGLMVLIALAGCAACYALVVRKVRQIVTARDLTIADELGALDAAIQALETRLAEHHLISLASAGAGSTGATAKDTEASGRATEVDPGSEAEVTGEIKAVIAATAIAALGEKAAVRSVRSVPAGAASPWSQQGRAMVQGSHNARAGR